MKYSIKQLHEELVTGKRTVRSLVDECLLTIASRDTDVHALLGLYTQEFIDAQVAKAEELFASGKATLLTGIPVVVKDNILVEGEKATAASKILEEYVAPYDATVIKHLKASGAVLVGRGNMDEFAMGGSTENSAYGPTKNPVNTTRVAGGSSGGSAAVVAYGGVPVSLGSDTGGSIRQPASFCGIVGLKTTYGNVSRYGVMSMGSSLDQIGPFGNSVEDVEIVYNTIAIHDEHDATSLTNTERESIKTPFKKVIGIPQSFVSSEGVDAEVLANFNETIQNLKGLGYSVVDISIKNIEKALSVYYVLMFAEVSSNLARYDGVRFGLSHPGSTSIRSYFESRTSGFGGEVRRRILLGTYVLSSGYYDAYYNKAVLVREMLKKEFDEVFKVVDVIATPTSPIPAFPLGERTDDPLSMYLADIFTVPVNIVGVPAISVPCGKNKDGLPLGIQFIAPHMREDVLFTVGKDVEKVY